MSRRLLPKPSFASVSSADENRVTKPLDRRAKRNCVATACMPCRKRRSKCDGQTPCAACLANDKSECFYDKESDGRRSGTLKKHVNELSSDNSNLRCILGTLQCSSDDYVRSIIYRLREKEDIGAIARFIKEHPPGPNEGRKFNESSTGLVRGRVIETEVESGTGNQYGSPGSGDIGSSSGYLGSSEHDGWQPYDRSTNPNSSSSPTTSSPSPNADICTTIRSWTRVTDDIDFIQHLLQLYFGWQHSSFPVFSRRKFLEDLISGSPRFCSGLLLNAILSIGCAFSDRPEARTNPQDPSTAGNHFFAEVERLLDLEEGDSKITTIQTLAVLSVRECGYLRDVKGWMYGSVALRALSEPRYKDGRNLTGNLDDPELEVWRATYWGLFCLDISWSLLLARLPQLSGEIWPLPQINYESEREQDFSEYTELEASWLSTGQSTLVHEAFLEFIKLSEISRDITYAFYGPANPGEGVTPKKLIRFHKRLCIWKCELSDDLSLQLANNTPQCFHIHMCLRATTIMLFRPFQKVQVEGLGKDLPMAICKRAAKELVNMAHKYRVELGLRRQILVISHYVFLATQTLLLDLPAEMEDLNRGLRILTETKDTWPGGGLGLFALPMIAHQWDIELPKETRAILDVLTETERRNMASTAWVSAREEEVSVITSDFLEYWERAFSNM